MKKILFVLIIISFFACSSNRKNVKPTIRFTELETKSNASLRGLFVVDENVVWASGSNGTVLISQSGGAKWKVIQINGAEENDFRSIYAWDENRAIVFGVAGPAFGYLTEDGGKNWETVFQDSTKGLFFNSLKFADENNGLAVSDPIDGKFFVLETKNGGKNWKRVIDIPDVEEGEANFAASNTCIEFLPSGKAWIASGGVAARVFYSTDFGCTWEVTKTPMVRGQASSGIFSIAFKNERQGVIVGGIYDQPEMNTNIAAFTNDGGITWHISKIMPKEYRSCVQYLSGNSNNYFLAAGKTGCDISIDGGENWNFISEKGYYSIRPVSGKLFGFASGSKGRIAQWEIIEE